MESMVHSKIESQEIQEEPSGFVALATSQPADCQLRQQVLGPCRFESQGQVPSPVFPLAPLSPTFEHYLTLV
jgi:hypothetical protein